MTQKGVTSGPASKPPNNFEYTKSPEAETLILAGTGTLWDIITDAGNYSVCEQANIAPT